jgi:hypothetical protein
MAEKAREAGAPTVDNEVKNLRAVVYEPFTKSNIVDEAGSAAFL